MGGVSVWLRWLVLILSIGLLLVMAVARMVLSTITAVNCKGTPRREVDSSIQATKRFSALHLFYCYVATAVILLINVPVLDSCFNYPFGWFIDVLSEVLCEICSSAIYNALRTKFSVSQICGILFNGPVMLTLVVFILCYLYGFLNILIV